MTWATWNPSDKSSGTTLSNGNLTTVITSGQVRSNLQIKDQTKRYWEITCTSASFSLLGVDTGSGNISYYTGQDMYGHGYYTSGSVYFNSTPSGSNASYTSGDIISCALDLVSYTLSYYKNGTLQGSFPVIAGDWYASVSCSGGGLTATTNFGASAFTYTPPTGFTGVDGVAGTSPTAGYAIWDTANKGTVCSLSDTSYGTYCTATGFIRATKIVNINTKRYWEVTTAALGGAQLIGIDNGSGNLNQFLGANSQNYGAYQTGNIYHNSSPSGGGTGFALGNVIGCLLDLVGNTFSINVNNVASSSVSVVAQGYYPAAGGNSGLAIANANFGQFPFVYSVPAGYTGGVDGGTAGVPLRLWMIE